MNVILAEGISKTYGEKILFQNLTLGLEKGQKVGLVARNGSGKSTLLNILAQKEDSDAGTISYREGYRLAYLDQNPDMPEGVQVKDYLFSSDSEVSRTINEYESTLYALKKEDNKQNQDRLQRAISLMDQTQAWNYEHRVNEVLSKLGFQDLEQQVSLLSGGQKRKLSLARVLLENVDILFLDEPTNHLDIQMIEWLEAWLNRENLTLLVVTHDRYFLDNVCTEVFELDGGQIYKYKGNYDYFLEKRAERIYNESVEKEKARAEYLKELEWARRMPKARTTKSKARMDGVNTLHDKAFKRTEKEMASLHVKTDRIGGKILEIYNINKHYQEQIILDDFSYVFKKGDRIGISGPNGVGKTTLLNMIMGVVKPDTGRIITGQTIKFGYFTQNGIEHRDDMRVIEIVKEAAESIQLESGQQVSPSQFLLHFGFSPTVQYNYYGNLSGGERRRLHLLMTLMQNPNFLILDEPTNDLDVYTLELLEDFLANYPGCLLIVSHDRSFMDHLIDHLFVFEGNGKVRDFPGNYSQYIDWKTNQEKMLVQEAKAKKETTPRRESSKPNKPSYKQQKEYEELEKSIEALETEKDELLKKLNTLTNPNEITACSERIGRVMNELDEKSNRWLELSELF